MPHKHEVLGDIENGIFFRRHWAILILLLLFVGGVAVYLSHGTLLSGDEHFYYVNGKRWSRFVLSCLQAAPLSLWEFSDRVVANGWFLPGMGIALAPVHLVLGSDVTVGYFRGYMTAVNLALVFLIIRGLVKLGVPSAHIWLFLLLSCTIPYYLFFLGALWGDLVAAHLAILLLIYLERNLHSDPARFGLGCKQALALGLMLGAISLIRPQYVMLPGIVLARIGLQFLPGKTEAMAARQSLGNFVKVGVIVMLSFALVLAPWHFALHKKFGATFMVTSLNLNPLFHDPGFSSAALSEYDTPSRYGAVQQKIMASAQASSRTFQEQVAIERARVSAQAGEPTTRRLKRSMSAFYLSENTFLERFLNIQDDPGKYSGAKGEFLLSVNSLAWRFLLAIGMLAFCLPAYPWSGNCLAALSLKGLLLMLSLQPLLTIMPHGRYYVGLIPVCALLVSLQVRASPLDAWTRYREFSLRAAVLLMVQLAALAYGVTNLWVYHLG
jgi:hypothetical protein